MLSLRKRRTSKLLLEPLHQKRKVSSVTTDSRDHCADGRNTFRHDRGFHRWQESFTWTNGCKLFKGRGKFHSNDYYHIGPYKSTKEYVLACYDREIYYYTHASASDIDFDIFKDVPLEPIVQQLRDKRSSLEAYYTPLDEPFVLVHGDFNGRNIMMQGTVIMAVLDWEFSRAYPFSELIGGLGVDVLEVIDEESEEENSEWNVKILGMVVATARKMGWPDNEVVMLAGSGDPIFGYAGTEMCPVV